MARKRKTGIQAEGHPQQDEPETGQQKSASHDGGLSTQPETAGEPGRSAGFPIVGVGASAGGLAAFEAFLSAMPADIDTGMAFVLVQHLAPDHKSILSELIRRYTRMEVFEVEDGMTVRPDCTYIIPPNHDMALLNGTLHLLEPTPQRGLRMSIDFLLPVACQDQGDRAICIVLSGTGSDGTLGVRAVKGEGGMVMVQAPESTEYDGMPQSAIATGMVDFILPPEDMPAQLLAYADHMGGIGKRTPATRPGRKPKRHSTRSVSCCVRIQGMTSHNTSRTRSHAGSNGAWHCSRSSSRTRITLPANECCRSGGALQRSPDRCHQFFPRSGCV